MQSWQLHTYVVDICGRELSNILMENVPFKSMFYILLSYLSDIIRNWAYLSNKIGLIENIKIWPSHG